jgi:hypothetical protein
MMFVWMLLQRLLGPMHLVLAPALRVLPSAASLSVKGCAAGFSLLPQPSPCWSAHELASGPGHRSLVLAPIPIRRT